MLEPPHLQFPLKNHLKGALRDDRVTLCTSVRLLTSPAYVLMAAALRYDGVYVDLEHGRLDPAAVRDLCLSALMAGVTPLVRLASGSPGEAAMALDSGALGVIVPHAESHEQMSEIVEACRFPPRGRRSAVRAMPQFGFHPEGRWYEHLDVTDDPLVIAMVESASGMSELERIARVDGVDAVFVGAGDLAASLGTPGRTSSEPMREAFAQIAAICRDTGTWWGVGGVKDNLTLLSALVDDGARFLSTRSDLDLLSQALATEAHTWEELRCRSSKKNGDRAHRLRDTNS